MFEIIAPLVLFHPVFNLSLSKKKLIEVGLHWRMLNLSLYLCRTVFKFDSEFEMYFEYQPRFFLMISKYHLR